MTKRTVRLGADELVLPCNFGMMFMLDYLVPKVAAGEDLNSGGQLADIIYHAHLAHSKLTGEEPQVKNPTAIYAIINEMDMNGAMQLLAEVQTIINEMTTYHAPAQNGQEKSEEDEEKNVAASL